jgi:acyl-CoA thioesterase-1
MRRWCSLWLILVLLAPLPALARTILVLGDSLSAAFGMDASAGWVALLDQRIAQKKPGYKVVNASISGDTTANGLARLPPLLERHQPDIVIVELGGNDGLRGLPTEQMKHNILAIIAKAKAAKARVLLAGVPLPPNYGSRYIEKFRQVYREVAREQGVPLVPSIIDGVGGIAGLMQEDGIHPNAAAQPEMLENIWDQLKPML